MTYGVPPICVFPGLVTGDHPVATSGHHGGHVGTRPGQRLQQMLLKKMATRNLVDLPSYKMVIVHRCKRFRDGKL